MGKYTSELLEGERRVPGWNLLPGIYPRETLSYGHGGVGVGCAKEYHHNIVCFSGKVGKT